VILKKKIALGIGAIKKDIVKLSIAHKNIVIQIQRILNVSNQSHVLRIKLCVHIHGASLTMSIKKVNSVMRTSVLKSRIRELFNVTQLIIMPIKV